MAFKSQDLSVLAYANGFTLWHYRTEDNYGIIDNEGYFNDAFEMLQVGDVIIANTTFNSSTPMFAMYLVRINSNGVVDVSIPTAFGQSNPD
ncbi:MAG: hypothetical protein AAF220_07510 [Pseudomonadota bacterium]